MDQTNFFQQGDISVDRSLARFGSTSYPIANIGSVSTQRVGNGLLLLVGCALLLGGIFFLINSGFGPGIVLLVMGFLIAYGARAQTALVLRTASGDVHAIKSPDHELVATIKAAIEQAITQR